MKASSAVLVLCVCAMLLSGCVVRRYTVTQEPADQNLKEGNLGYVEGDVPLPPERQVNPASKIVQVELHPLIKFDGPAKKKPVEPQALVTATATVVQTDQQLVMEEYTVQPGDTLQKIAKKFYGRVGGWNEIFEANKDTMDSPDKIYPGKVLNIPVMKAVPVVGEEK